MSTAGGIVVEEIGWIACADELPDSDTTVLVYAPGATEPIWLAYYDVDSWFAVSGEEYDNGEDGEIAAKVTHWAVLPSGPVDP